MLETFDKILKCLGPCHVLSISPSVQWEYSIACPFPTPRDLIADRIYCQAALVAVQTRSQISTGVFRFTVWGGGGNVGFLVAEDIKEKILVCSNCRIRDFDLQLTSSPFPKRNSDQEVSIAVLSFKVVV
jgi:hypothetical protein